MHTDLIGQTYICYLLTRTSKLQLVRLEKATSSQRQIFGIAVSIPAKDAIGLDVMYSYRFIYFSIFIVLIT